MSMTVKALLFLAAISIVILIVPLASAEDLCAGNAGESSFIYNGRAWGVEICPDYARRLVYDPEGELELWVRFYYQDGLGVTFPNGPVTVTLSFGDWRRCHCQNESLYDDATIGADGWAVFNYRGGGCNGDYDTEFAVEDNEIGHTYVIKKLGYNPVFFGPGTSADAVDPAGNEPKHPDFDPEGACNVGLNDAVFHTLPIKNALASLCSDLDGLGDTDLGDAVRLTPPLSHSNFCLEAP